MGCSSCNKGKIKGNGSISTKMFDEQKTTFVDLGDGKGLLFEPKPKQSSLDEMIPNA